MNMPMDFLSALGTVSAHIVEHDIVELLGGVTPGQYQEHVGTDDTKPLVRQSESYRVRRDRVAPETLECDGLPWEYAKVERCQRIPLPLILIWLRDSMTLITSLSFDNSTHSMSMLCPSALSNFAQLGY